MFINVRSLSLIEAVPVPRHMHFSLLTVGDTTVLSSCLELLAVTHYNQNCELQKVLFSLILSSASVVFITTTVQERIWGTPMVTGEPTSSKSTLGGTQALKTPCDFPITVSPSPYACLRKLAFKLYRFF